MEINLLNIPVFYINLEKDISKRTRIEAILTKLGFTDVRRFEGYDIEIPKLGCATSHNSLLKKISKISGPVLVLEDDVKVTKSFNSIVNVPDDADAVYLGLSKYGLYNSKGAKRVSAEKYDDDLFRIYNMLGAHAILYLNKKYPTFLSQATSFMVSINDNQDKARASTMKFFNVYAFNKPMFYQNNYHKDATLFQLDHYRDVVGKELSI